MCVVVDKGGDAVCARGDAWVGVYVECVLAIGRMRRAMMSGG